MNTVVRHVMKKYKYKEDLTVATGLLSCSTAGYDEAMHWRC